MVVKKRGLFAKRPFKDLGYAGQNRRYIALERVQARRNVSERTPTEISSFE
jgi:hypothetical protein